MVCIVKIAMFVVDWSFGLYSFWFRMTFALNSHLFYDFPLYFKCDWDLTVHPFVLLSSFTHACGRRLFCCYICIAWSSNCEIFDLFAIPCIRLNTQRKSYVCMHYKYWLFVTSTLNFLWTTESNNNNFQFPWSLPHCSCGWINCAAACICWNFRDVLAGWCEPFRLHISCENWHVMVK